jgi:hypothetical protein
VKNDLLKFFDLCQEYLKDLWKSIFSEEAFIAGVVELVDTPDLGSGDSRRGGSSPSARTSK